MSLRIACLLMICSLPLVQARSQIPATHEIYDIIGSAFLDNASYDLLERLCDEAGGRFVGSPNNEKALGIMRQHLERLGYKPRLEEFTMPGWKRGNDEVILLSPTYRKLRSVALGYVNTRAPIEADVVSAGYGFDEDYPRDNVRGGIVLVTSERPVNRTPLLRYEAIDIAAAHGASAIMFINTKSGGATLSGVSNFQGHPGAVPAFSLTYEEGRWLQRLLERGIVVRIRLVTNSKCLSIETANLIATLPGRSTRKIVVGAHFDSWDVGQGAIDNGLGTAILFDVARIMKSYSPLNRYAIDFVWFNGEELGLWGSKQYVKEHRDENIIAMINLDMTGMPTGLNAMGNDTLVPFLKKLVHTLNGFDLSAGVRNTPSINSDHQPFMLAGIPTISLQSHLDQQMVQHYHDFGDTFDKVSKKYLSEAVAVVSILLRELANNSDLLLHRASQEEVIKRMERFNLDKRLQRQKEWPFGE